MLNLTKQITLSGKMTKGKLGLLGSRLLLALFRTQVNKEPGARETGEQEGEEGQSSVGGSSQ